MSLLTGQIITQVQKLHPKLIAYEIASALAVLCGAFVFVLGILRLGYVVIFCHMSHSTYVARKLVRFIVDFIPLTGESESNNSYPLGCLTVMMQI